VSVTFWIQVIRLNLRSEATPDAVMAESVVDAPEAMTLLYPAARSCSIFCWATQGDPIVPLGDDPVIAETEHEGYPDGRDPDDDRRHQDLEEGDSRLAA
jgi:hypothetical protein